MPYTSGENTPASQFFAPVLQALPNNNSQPDTGSTPGGTDNDTDGDGINNEEHNCSTVSNPDQNDTDTNGFGNDCDKNGSRNLATMATQLQVMCTMLLANQKQKLSRLLEQC